MGESVNIELFRLINQAHSSVGDAFFGIISGLGDGLVVALLCALVMLFHLRDGMAALLAFLVSGLLAQALKRMVDMPRPPAILEHVHVLGASLYSHSFPSGHATSDGVMLVLALLLWKRSDWRRWLVAGCFLFAAIGRVYGGVHFPADILVGLVIGGLSMLLCARWSQRWSVEQWQASDIWWRIVGMIVVVEAAVLGLGYHIQPATAKMFTWLLPVLSLVVVGQFWKGKLQQAIKKRVTEGEQRD